MAKKILITGGAGYIGSHTALELLNEGYEVVVYDNLCNSSKESLKRVEELTGKTITFYEGDVMDEAALKAMLEKEGVDAVIHCAALKAVGESVQKPLEYYRNCIQFFCNCIRKSGRDADHRGVPEGTVYESLWMDKVYDGTDHDRCTEGKSGYECHPASLFQPGRST